MSTALAELHAEPEIREAARPPRLIELDVLRALALLGVVIIHAGAWLAPESAPPSAGIVAGIVAIARCSVPAFVLASGFALAYQYPRPVAEPFAFLRRRCTRIAGPWLGGVLLFGLLGPWQGKFHDLPSAIDWLVSGPGHLYFLVLIAQLYALYVLLPRGGRGLALAVAAAVAVQLALGALHTYLPPAAGPLAWPGDRLVQEEFPLWAGYFLLGCWAGSRAEDLLRLHRWWPGALAASVVGGAMLFLEGNVVVPQTAHEGLGAFFWPSRLPLTLALSLLILWSARALLLRAGRLPSIAASLSRHSLGVYVLHPLVLAFIGAPSAALPAALRFLVLIALTTALPLLVIVQADGRVTAAKLHRLFECCQADRTQSLALRDGASCDG